MISDITSVDHDALPQALLSAFKQHERIDHCDDDELIVSLLQGAIEEFERNSGVSIFEREIVLYPASDDFDNGAASLEVTPINTSAITAPPAEGGAPQPVDADYRIVGRGIHGVRLYSLEGAWQDELTITITTGYTIATLPPGIRREIMRLTGHVYEYREIYLPNGIQEQPEWKLNVMSGFWKPRM